MKGCVSMERVCQHGKSVSVLKECVSNERMCQHGKGVSVMQEGVAYLPQNKCVSVRQY